MEMAISAPNITVQDTYFAYLCELVRINDEHYSYYLLAQELHNITFYSMIPHDENRAVDGIMLRNRFIQDSSFINYESIEEKPCTFFEFLIGLAIRMAFILEDSDDDEKIPTYFHELLENCGLDLACDEAYMEGYGRDYVQNIVERILSRKYKKDGTGGLFPIHTWIKKDKDQRKVEIWYQMARYLIDRE